MTDVRKTFIESAQRSLLDKPAAKFALDVTDSPKADAFERLQQRREEVIERVRAHGAVLRQIRAEEVRVSRLWEQHKGEPGAPTLAELQILQDRVKALSAEFDDAQRELDALNTLATRGSAPDQPLIVDDLVRDIAITVGYLAYPTAKGSIPVYPIIVCEFANAMGFKRELLSRLELAIDEDGRYKLYTPGNEDEPFAETDDPVDAPAHEAFQRLSKHWGYWFLRVRGALNEWDFQIIGNRVYPLDSPIETSLSVLENTRVDVVRMAVLGSRHEPVVATAEAQKVCDRFEALVGKMPVKRQGLQYTADVVHARVIQKNLKNMQANASWVRLDPTKLESQLKKIMGGPFVSVVWEEVRTGVDFMQLMSRTEGNHGPDVWLRARRGRRQNVAPAAKVKAFDQELPLESFQPENAESLREEDLVAVRQFYLLPTERLRQAKAARIETTHETASSEVDKKTHEAIVQNYLNLCRVLRVTAAGNDPNAQRVWPLLREAVIFELPAVAHTTLWEEFFRYCVRSAKLDPNVPLKDHTDKQRKRVMEVIGTGSKAPFPEKLPFRSCFFAYGAGVYDPNGDLLEEEIRQKETGAVPPSVGKLYGHLVTDAGVVVSFRHLDRSHNGQEGIIFTFDRDPTSSKGQEWDRPHTLTPWIVNALVSYVNEHKKLVESGSGGFAYQSLVKKTAKKLAMKAPIPPPFYVVYLKDEFIREQARQRAASIKRHIDWQHRWNVRGHDCLRFMRGPLPIDHELEKELLARKYKIYTVDQPDSDTFMALAKRGVPPKGADEWLAVLAYWRDSFVKGPADKPLVESVRRSTKSWGGE